MKTTALVLLSLLLLVAVLAASWAARMETETDGTFAVAASKGRVALGVGREVLITDDAGALLGVARAPDGTPWSFGDIVSVNFDEKQNVYVCDMKNAQVVELDPDGANGRVLPLEDLPHLPFEALPYRDNIYIADTVGHHLRKYDRAGKQLDSKRVRYPNGLTLVTTDKGPLLMMAERGAAQIVAWTLDLEPAEWPPGAAFNLGLKGAPFHQVLEATVTPQGELIAAVCRSPGAECSIARHRADGRGLERLADSLSFKAPVPDAVDNVLQTGEIAVTQEGSLLMTLPRAAAVLRFSATNGQLAGDYCESCSAAELKADTIDVATLTTPLRWKNGTEIALFGGPELLSRYAAQREAWARFAAVEHLARYSTYGVATALLVLLFLARQSGAAESGLARGRRVWAELVRPELRALGAAVLVIAFAVAASGAAGFAWLEWTGVLAIGVPLGLLVARWVSPRILLALRSPAAADKAFAIFLAPAGALAPGERLLWVRFAMPLRPLKAELAAFQAASKADDLIDALEFLAPRLMLLARTDQRLLAVQTSMVGAPLAPMLELGVPGPVTPTGTVDLIAVRLARRWRIGPGADQRVHAETARYRCERCGKPFGSCPHTDSGLAVPLLASLLFPGVGAMVRGDFGRARLNAIVGLGFLSQAAKEYFPQSFGTFAWRPSLWLLPLYGYLGALLAGAAAVVLAWMADRRRVGLR